MWKAFKQVFNRSTRNTARANKNMAFDGATTKYDLELTSSNPNQHNPLPVIPVVDKDISIMNENVNDELEYSEVLVKGGREVDLVAAEESVSVDLKQEHEGGEEAMQFASQDTASDEVELRPLPTPPTVTKVQDTKQNSSLRYDYATIGDNQLADMSLVSDIELSNSSMHDEHATFRNKVYENLDEANIYDEILVNVDSTVPVMAERSDVRESVYDAIKEQEGGLELPADTQSPLQDVDKPEDIEEKGPSFAKTTVNKIKNFSKGFGRAAHKVLDPSATNLPSTLKSGLSKLGVIKNPEVHTEAQMSSVVKATGVDFPVFARTENGKTCTIVEIARNRISDTIWKELHTVTAELAAGNGWPDVSDKNLQNLHLYADKVSVGKNNAIEVEVDIDNCDHAAVVAKVRGVFTSLGIPINQEALEVIANRLIQERGAQVDMTKPEPDARKTAEDVSKMDGQNKPKPSKPDVDGGTVGGNKNATSTSVEGKGAENWHEAIVSKASTFTKAWAERPENERDFKSAFKRGEDEVEAQVRGKSSNMMENEPRRSRDDSMQRVDEVIPRNNGPKVIARRHSLPALGTSGCGAILHAPQRIQGAELSEGQVAAGQSVANRRVVSLSYDENRNTDIDMTSVLRDKKTTLRHVNPDDNKRFGQDNSAGALYRHPLFNQQHRINVLGESESLATAPPKSWAREQAITESKFCPGGDGDLLRNLPKMDDVSDMTEQKNEKGVQMPEITPQVKGGGAQIERGRA